MSPETPIRPHYERPPLIEQAISISFDPIPGFSIVDFGLFWQELAGEFPDVQTTDRLETPVETFDAPMASSLQFNLLASAPMPRALFRNGRGEIIHIQDDRFGYNWAKIGGAEYPRSEAVMANFEANFQNFCRFIRKRGLPDPVIQQCELTNLNLIPVAAFGSDFTDVSEALNIDPLDLGIDFLPPETLVRNRQHKIVDDEGAPIGRLHISIAPVISQADRSKAFRFELTARSARNINSFERARWFYQISRNAINGTFEKLVTEKMKAIWGERR